MSYKYKPSRFILGILLIAAVSLVFLELNRTIIEDDLKQRAEAALKKEGIGWARLSLSGRDIILAGEEQQDDEERLRAVAVLNNVFGIRHVKDLVKPLDYVVPYKWYASREESRLKLRSYVPSENDRKTILAFAQANIPSLEIHDRMTLASGAPPRTIWLGGVSYALRLLSKFGRGSVEIEGTSLSVTGIAKDTQCYEKLLKSLQTEIPEGITLKQFSIQPPEVKPYIWSVLIQNSSVILKGNVLNQDMHHRMVGVAKQHYPNYSIIDSLGYASGMPADWENVVIFSMEYLKDLEEAQLLISDKDVTLYGYAKDEITAKKIDQFLKEKLPKSYSLINRIKIKEQKNT